MSQAEASIQLSSENLGKALRTHLFPVREEDSGTNTFAVLDGASIPDLLDRLYGKHRPDFACLYRGELEPDMAEVAPYLVRLETKIPFTEWLLTEGWGRHWGIFVQSKANLEMLRRHFRRFLMVKMPAGKQAYFRYYDPRVLRLYLPTCSAEESNVIFGPVGCYLCEGTKLDLLLVFRRRAEAQMEEAINLKVPSAVQI